MQGQGGWVLTRPDSPALIPYSQGKTYWAVKGKGAWLRNAEGQKRIQCAEFGFEDPGLKICASASHLNKETEVGWPS